MEQEVKTLEEIKSQMKEIWTELGRDVNKINLENKSREQLEDGLEKLKAVKMGFRLLFKEDGNHALAVHLLSKVFLGDDGETQEEPGD